jgi:hypothetical protein
MTRFNERAYWTLWLIVLWVILCTVAAGAAVIPKTVNAGEVFTATVASDARWQSGGRDYLSPFFAAVWAYEGTYDVICTPGDDYRVTVVKAPRRIVDLTPATGSKLTAPQPNTTYRLAPGSYGPYTTITLRDAAWVVAADPRYRPVINWTSGANGFDVKGKAQLHSLVLRGGTNCVTLSKGADVSVIDVAVENGGRGISCSFPGVVACYASGLTQKGMRAYPVGLFAASNVFVVDFNLTGYAGGEHPVRVAANTISGVLHPSKNVYVGHGSIVRNYKTSSGAPAKEALTVRRAERVSVDKVSVVGGHAAIRLCVENTTAEGAQGRSKNIYVRRCTLAGPIWVRYQGIDGWVIDSNTFKNIATAALGAPPLQIESNAKVLNGRLTNNVWVGGSGAWWKGNPGPNFTNANNTMQPTGGI